MLENRFPESGNKAPKVDRSSLADLAVEQIEASLVEIPEIPQSINKTTWYKNHLNELKPRWPQVDREDPRHVLNWAK